jgi:MYXO-CTERM domain-containing protein
MISSAVSFALLFAMTMQAPQLDCATQLAVDGENWSNSLTLKANGIVWLAPLTGSGTYSLRFERQTVDLVEAPEHGERVIYGGLRKAFRLALDPGTDECAALLSPNSSGMSSLCLEAGVDEEAPLDIDQLSATIGKPQFGTSSGDQRLAPRCSGLGEGGNLQVRVPSDETQPLFALITVEQGGSTLVDGTFPFQGIGTFSFHVASEGVATVSARLMDHAGNIGEPTSVKADPPGGCSSAPLGLSALLLGLGLRRRRREPRATA